jgi:hypothetical protein
MCYEREIYIFLILAHPSNVDYGEIQTTPGGKILALQDQPVKVIYLRHISISTRGKIVK